MLTSKCVVVVATDIQGDIGEPSSRVMSDRVEGPLGRHRETPDDAIERLVDLRQSLEHAMFVIPRPAPVASDQMASETKPNRRGARSRELVLDAAERIMAAEGYEAAALARIVEESEIPISSVYHYFGSKDGGLLAVMERGAERFFDLVPEAETLIDDPHTHLSRLVANVCEA